MQVDHQGHAVAVVTLEHVTVDAVLSAGASAVVVAGEPASDLATASGVITAPFVVAPDYPCFIARVER